MRGTATSKLLAFSSAAWPPSAKTPTLWPVLPRLRVGIASWVRGLLGIGQDLVSAEAVWGSAPARAAAAATVPPLRKARRSLRIWSKTGLRGEVTDRCTTGG